MGWPTPLGGGELLVRARVSMGIPQVVIVGRPNVGKSSLFNWLAGRRIAIVDPTSGVTRDRVTHLLNLHDRYVELVDTGGMGINDVDNLADHIEEQISLAIDSAHVILFVVDVSVPPRDEDAHIARLLKAQAEKRRVVFVLNKMDKLAITRAESRISSYWALLPSYADSIPTSALEGTNLKLLQEHTLKFLPEGPRYYPGDQITDQTEHQIAAELIREAMLRFTRQEVPHAAAVLVEDYHERDNGVLYVSARIWVERESQKPIVIGKQGRRLKQIGTAARAELERFVGGKVYLDLWVKVRPKWRDHDGRLRELGF